MCTRKHTHIYMHTRNTHKHTHTHTPSCWHVCACPSVLNCLGSLLVFFVFFWSPQKTDSRPFYGFCLLGSPKSQTPRQERGPVPGPKLRELALPGFRNPASQVAKANFLFWGPSHIFMESERFHTESTSKVQCLKKSSDPEPHVDWLVFLIPLSPLGKIWTSLAGPLGLVLVGFQGNRLI